MGSEDEGDFCLRCDDERAILVHRGDTRTGGVSVDFVEGALGHRRKFGGGRGQSLARAVGLKGGANPTVVDATAGLGRDGFILANLGCRVTLVEQHPAVAALLADGLERARRHPETAATANERLQLVCADAVTYLVALQEDERPDVIYLDPMFPKRQKAAKVKKEMQFLQLLLDESDDGSRLLAAALTAARQRVVVKRPARAPWLGDRKPTTAIETPNHRFDVYVIKALREEGSP